MMYNIRSNIFLNVIRITFRVFGIEYNYIYIYYKMQ